MRFGCIATHKTVALGLLVADPAAEDCHDGLESAGILLPALQLMLQAPLKLQTAAALGKRMLPVALFNMLLAFLAEVHMALLLPLRSCGVEGAWLQHS